MGGGARGGRVEEAVVLLGGDGGVLCFLWLMLQCSI